MIVCDIAPTEWKEEERNKKEREKQRRRETQRVVDVVVVVVSETVQGAVGFSFEGEETNTSAKHSIPTILSVDMPSSPPLTPKKKRQVVLPAQRETEKTD